MVYNHMFVNKLEICGKINKETIKTTDNKVFLTINTRINNNDKYKSLVYVEFNKNIWDKINPCNYNEDLVITGEIQARKTKNNSPFIYLKTHDVMLKSKSEKKKNKIKNNQKQNQKQITQDIVKTKVRWRYFFEDEDLQTLDISKVYLKEEKHMKGTIDFHTRTHRNTRDRVSGKVVVKAEDDGRYSLIIGFNEFVHCKLLERDIEAYITDLSIEEFIEKYVNTSIDETNEETGNETNALEEKSTSNDDDNQNNTEEVINPEN